MNNNAPSNGQPQDQPQPQYMFGARIKLVPPTPDDEPKVVIVAGFEWGAQSKLACKGFAYFVREDKTQPGAQLWEIPESAIQGPA